MAYCPVFDGLVVLTRRALTRAAQCTASVENTTTVAVGSGLPPGVRTAPPTPVQRSVKVTTTSEMSDCRSNGDSEMSRPLYIADLNIQPTGDPGMRSTYRPPG